MKKLYLLVILAMTLIASGANAQTDTPLLTYSDLVAAVSLLNNDCPAEMDDGMVMQSVEFVDNEIVATILTKEDDATIQMIGMMADTLAPMFINNFKADPDMVTIFDACKQNNINFAIKFTNANGTSANIQFKHEMM